MLKIPKTTDRQFVIFIVFGVLTSILLQAIILSVLTVESHVDRIEVEILSEPSERTKRHTDKQPDAANSI